MAREYKIRDYKQATRGRTSAHYHEFFIITEHPFRPEALAERLNAGAPPWARVSVSHPGDEVRRQANVFVVSSHTSDGAKLAERVLQIVAGMEVEVDSAQAHERALGLLEAQEV